MIKLFGKKEEKKPQEEPQIKRTLLRGPNGKFIGQKGKKAAKKKAKKEEKPSLTKAPIKVTFYGREISKIHDGQNWYFCVNNIIALARPPLGKEVVHRKKTFNEVQKKVAKTFNGITYSDAAGCLELTREVEAAFPGPLARWLRESSKMAYKEPPKVDKKEVSTEPIAEPVVNPSDRR